MYIHVFHYFLLQIIKKHMRTTLQSWMWHTWVLMPLECSSGEMGYVCHKTDVVRNLSVCMYLIAGTLFFIIYTQDSQWCSGLGSLCWMCWWNMSECKVPNKKGKVWEESVSLLWKLKQNLCLQNNLGSLNVRCGLRSLLRSLLTNA